ncbi:MAB_1171c family putative transporter [Streptomyces sp. Act-28]
MEIAVQLTLWIVAITRIPSAFRSPKQRMLWATFMLWAIARSLGNEALNDRVDGMAGIEDLATLLKHLLGVLSAITALRFVGIVTGADARNRRAPHTRLMMACVILLTMCLLFALPDTIIHDSPEQLLTGPVPSWGTIAYWVALELYIGLALASVAVLLWRAGRRSTQHFLRWGLLCISVGAALDLLYAIYKIGLLTILLSGGAVPVGPASKAADTLQAIAILLMTIGSVIPAADVVWRAQLRYVTLRRLAPLWRTLQRQFPHVVLDHSNAGALADLLGLRQSHLRLYRRVIEIRDGMLLLQPHISQELYDSAHQHVVRSGVSGKDLVEATAIACCLRCVLLAGNRYATPDTALRLTMPGRDELSQEAKFLALISRAFHRSDVVGDFFARHPVMAARPATARE